MKAYVLDANALLTHVQNGPSAAKLDQLFEDAFLKKTSLLISVLQWSEVFYLLWRQFGESHARQTMDRLSHLSLQIVPVDLGVALKAAELKSTHGMPFVDCFAAALALQNEAVLVTSDTDFRKLGQHFRILWIRH